MALEIVQIPAGQADNFSYLIYCPVTMKGVGVDPSFAPQAMLDKVTEIGMEMILLVNTHGHQDHTHGNGEILEKTGVKLAAHIVDMPQADIALTEGTKISVGAGTVTVLHTPGHTPGSVVLRTENAIVTGDTLFVSRCGRADLPGSNVNQLFESLQRLKALPGQTRVYPGHDYGPRPVSTLDWELENNEFIKCHDLESFITLRMG